MTTSSFILHPSSLMSDLVAAHLIQYAATPLKKTGEPPRRNSITAHRLQLERFAHHMDTSPPPNSLGGAGGVDKVIFIFV